MTNCLQQWNQSYPITDSELQLLFPTEQMIEEQPTETAVSQFFDLIGSKLADTHCLDLNSQGATSIIKQLFEYYNDPNTLFVISDLEHPAVKQFIPSIKDHCYIIREFDDVFNVNQRLIDDIVQHSKHYDNVFVYVIGMQNAFMKPTPTEFYTKLKQSLTIPSIVCIDAVQELFLTPRDYSQFDYVIGTAHATISNFNLGLLIRNKHVQGFNQDGLLNRLAMFIKQLNVLLSRQQKLHSFNQAMTTYFQQTCPFKYKQLDTVDYAFSFELDCKITQAEYKLFEKVLSLKYDVAVAPFQTTIIVRYRAPSIILGVNFNNDICEKTLLEEGLKKTYQLCLMLLDRAR